MLTSETALSIYTKINHILYYRLSVETIFLIYRLIRRSQLLYVQLRPSVKKPLFLNKLFLLLIVKRKDSRFVKFISLSHATRTNPTISQVNRSTCGISCN